LHKRYDVHRKYCSRNLKGRDCPEDNIRMDLGELGWEDMDWIHLAQDRDKWQDLVNTVMKLRVP